MNLPFGNTPPAFESGEEYQEWLRGEYPEGTKQYNLEFSDDAEPPKFDLEKEYEAFLQGKNREK